MVVVCCALGCSNRYSTGGNIQFHKFPFKDDELLQKWILAIGRIDFVPNNCTRLCSDHFTSDAYQIRPGASWKLLRSQAVPTIFLPHIYQTRKRFRKKYKKRIPIEIVKCESVEVEHENHEVEIKCEPIDYDEIEVTEQEIKVEQPDVIDIPEVIEVMEDPLINDVSAIKEIHIDNALDNIISDEKSEEIKDENLTPKCFNKICRVCLKEVQYFIKYSLCYFNEKSLSYYLKKYTGVSVDLMDCNGIRLPETICTECMTAVLKFDEFAQKCLTSDEKLKEITNRFLDNDHDYISTRMDSLDEDLPPIESNVENIIATNSDNVIPPKATTATNVYLRNQKHWTCKICGKDGITSIKYLRIHNMRKHNATPIFEAPDKINDRKCILCSKIYKTPGLMREHMRVHTNEKPYQCEICGVKFKMKTTLSSHRLTHDKNKNVRCDLCGKAYRNSIQLRNHHRIVHIFQETICEICGQLLKNKTIYRYHMNRHKDIKILCPICGKYINKRTYSRHRQTHSGFKCRVCHFSFANYNSLKLHEKVHRGINPYKCRFCKKKFNDPLVKAEHMKLECRKKIYVCQICKKAFAVEGNLRVHMRIHTGDLPFECDLCNEKFNFLGGIKAHYAKFHENECIENRVFVKIKTK